jgi:hypothetical protein
MNLRDRFILTGLVPPTEIPQLTAAMDVLVHPSRREGLARAIVQGQLAGAPAIAYDIDGNREGLLHGQPGYIVPPFDARKLAAHVPELVENAPKRSAIAAAGRALSPARVSAQVMVDAGVCSQDDPAILGVRHMLTNVLGGAVDEVEVDVDLLGMEDGDRLLLCSDGLTDSVDDETIGVTLQRALSSREASERLVQLALDGGGNDNITVIVASFEFPPAASA